MNWTDEQQTLGRSKSKNVMYMYMSTRGCRTVSLTGSDDMLKMEGQWEAPPRQKTLMMKRWSWSCLVVKWRMYVYRWSSRNRSSDGRARRMTRTDNERQMWSSATEELLNPLGSQIQLPQVRGQRPRTPIRSDGTHAEICQPAREKKLSRERTLR